jgi:hypothetical protein
LDLLPDPLVEDIIRNRCIPIIGAGFSLNSKLPHGFQMPLWKGIGTLFAKQMKDYPPDTSSLEAISAFCHEYSKPNAIDQIRDLLQINKAEPGPAHLSFAALPFDVVLTTNFDLLLEKAYDIKKIPFYPVLHDDQLSTSSIVNLSVSNNDT